MKPRPPIVDLALIRSEAFHAAQAGDGVVDYWRAAATRGVMALGFSRFEHGGGADMLAEPTGALEGWTRRAAHAAIEVHKLVAAEPGMAAHAARHALLEELGRGPAIRALAVYQGLLVERLWREINEEPAQRLEALAYPHEE